MVVNLERSSVWQAQTDSFLKAAAVEICGNDYTAAESNPVRRLFAPATAFNPSPRPVFTIINCVADSPSHAYREVLVNEIYSGGGAQDFSASIRNWRQRIDAVQAAPIPALLSAPRGGGPGQRFEFVFTGQPGATYTIQATADFIQWIGIASGVPGTTDGRVIFDPNWALFPRRLYRAVQE